jgi:hypothetical protein
VLLGKPDILDGVYFSLTEFRVTALDGSVNTVIVVDSCTLLILGGEFAMVRADDSGATFCDASTMALGIGGTGSVNSKSGGNTVLSILILEVREGICQLSKPLGSLEEAARTTVYRLTFPVALETSYRTRAGSVSGSVGVPSNEVRRLNAVKMSGTKRGPALALRA